MLKLVNTVLNKVSNGLYKASLKAYDFEKNIAKKRVKVLRDCNSRMSYKIMENKDIIASLENIYDLNKGVMYK